jgi:hypothetical protein
MAAIVLCCGEERAKYFVSYRSEDLIRSGFADFKERRVMGSAYHKKLGSAKLRLQLGIPNVMDVSKPVNHQAEALRKGCLNIRDYLDEYPHPFRGNLYICLLERIDTDTWDDAPKRSITTYVSKGTALLHVDGEKHQVRVDAYTDLVMEFLRSDNATENLSRDFIEEIVGNSRSVNLYGVRAVTGHPEVAKSDENVSLVS